MSVTRAEALIAIQSAVLALGEDDVAAAAEVGAEACLLAIARVRGPTVAAQTAYGLEDALSVYSGGAGS